MLQDCGAPHARRQEAEHGGTEVSHAHVHASIRLRRARMRMARRQQSIDLMFKVARGECADEAQFGLRSPCCGGETLRLTAPKASTDRRMQLEQSHGDETACPAELWDWFVSRGTSRSRSSSPTSGCNLRSPSLSPSTGCSSRSSSSSPSLSPRSSYCGSESDSSQGSTPSPRPSPKPMYCSLM